MWVLFSLYRYSSGFYLVCIVINDYLYTIYNNLCSVL